MLTNRYLASQANLPLIMQKIVEGTAPEKFTLEHLKGLGFRSSNDRAFVPLLKDLGFLAADGTPTNLYHDYRDKSRSTTIMAKALLETYADLFTINENPTQNDRPVIEGKFKSTHNATDRVAQQQAATFFALLKLADLPAARRAPPSPPAEDRSGQEQAEVKDRPPSLSNRPVESGSLGLRYNIQVHLPPTKDPEVYNAIFKALREHLLVD